MERGKLIGIVAAVLAVAGVVRAQAGGVAVGAKVGTLGLGADVTLGLHERVSLRGSAGWLQFDREDDVEDIDYDLEIEFRTIMALLDWHPFANGFRVSGGVMFSDNEITLDAQPSESETIGGTTYTPEQIGTLHGLLVFDDLAPYAGIGYGRAVDEDGRWSFVFDLGILFQSYDVALSADGLAASSPQFQADLAEEEEDIQDALDDFSYYPVLAFGLAYRF